MNHSILLGSLVVAFSAGCGGSSSAAPAPDTPIASHSSGNTSSDVTGSTNSGPVDSSPVGTGMSNRAGAHDQPTGAGMNGMMDAGTSR